MSPKPPSARSAPAPRPLVLCILDGWGHRVDTQNNAIALADTPCFDSLWENHPHSLLRTDGEAVGLPRGQMGNSEVGHTTIGGGRVFWQDLPRIDQAIATKQLHANPHLQNIIKDLKDTRRTCHIIGLLSPGGIHSHQRHMAAVANMLGDAGVNVAIHGFLDGRDRPPSAAPADVTEFMRDLYVTPKIKIATLIGRYYAMDRDQRWDRIAKAYNLLVDGVGDRFGDVITGILTHHALGITDEFMEPLAASAYAGMADGDALVCINFRADRMRQILSALLLPTFNQFTRSRTVQFSHRVAMADYGGDTSGMLDVLFMPEPVTDTLAEIVSRHGLRQLRTAETEKYPHVTYYFNAGREEPWPGENRVLVPSPKVATYDLQPQMSAPDVTAKLVSSVNSGEYDVVVVNYANPDMVGHTGKLDAAVRAITALDGCLKKVVDATVQAGGALLITADHGNAEEMWDSTANVPHTQHSLNPVPCILVNGPSGHTLRDGTLADIAPTILKLLNLPQPTAMTGKSLLV
jgi:2,3-bisphosphoglycerate-independent phosphoglycerate mutase